MSSPKNHPQSPWETAIPGLTDSGLLTRERPRVAALLNGVRKAKKSGVKAGDVGAENMGKHGTTPYFDILSWFIVNVFPFRTCHFGEVYPAFGQAQCFSIWKTTFL
jgi:hypothetical protein